MSKQIYDNSLTGVRSNQNMSFNWLGSADFGRIVPFHVEELVGSDKVIKCRPKININMLPFVSKTFGEMSVYVHYFYVPTRLLWTDFYDFYSQSGVAENAAPPYWTITDFISAYDNAPSSAKRALYKHWTSMGLPPFWETGSPYRTTTTDAKNLKISLLPFRAYNQIWWDYYRDPEVLPDSNKELYLQVTGGHIGTGMVDNKYYPRMRFLKDLWFSELFASNGNTPSQFVSLVSNGNAATGNPVYSGSDTSQKLRQIEALTRMAERLSLGGKRQIDRLFAKAGIKPEFAKLNMCQYVGGAKANIDVASIVSSADTTKVDADGTGMPLGQVAGHGYCSLGSLNLKFTAGEPGYLVGVFSVVPKIHFTQGIGKRWIRNTREDWFTRELEHVGQIAVPKRDIAVWSGGKGSSPNYDLSKDGNTFAFTQPYYDYKMHPDILAGDFALYQSADLTFQSETDISYMQSLGIWTYYPMDREFSPENMQVRSTDANQVFYYFGGALWEDVDDHFHVNINVDCVINRPMDGYAVPTIETTEDPHKKTTSVGADTTL